MATPRKDPKDYVKTGRPTLYKPEYCQALIDLVSKGYSYEAFAGYLRVAIATLYVWEKEYPEFLEAKMVAKSLSAYVWEGFGIDGLHDEIKYCPKTGKPLSKKSLNSAVWIFNAKNRMGWKDKIENTVETTTPITLNYDPSKKA